MVTAHGGSRKKNSSTNNSKAKTSEQISLRRYTSLASLLHMLQTKKITLLNPATWDDKNDAYYMAEFKRLKNAQTLLALCFAESDETYHHWRVFSNGPDGVCLEFDKEKLLASLKTHQGIEMRNVQYRTINYMRKQTSIPIGNLPFLKRKPYGDEREFRVIYLDMKDAKEACSFPIELNWIKRITLSPWVATALRDSIAHTIKAIPDCNKLSVARSTLTGNTEWQSLTAKAV